jgi:hypothetical protein
MVLLLIVALLLMPIGCMAGGPYTERLPQPFDAERWKAADTWNDTRCGMIVDLMHRKGLEGRSREEVVGLLGEPEGERGEADLSHWHLCPSFMDIWILEVRWENGRVAKAWVRDT